MRLVHHLHVEDDDLVLSSNSEQSGLRNDLKEGFKANP